MPPCVVMIKPASGLCNMNCRYCFYKDEIAQDNTKKCGIMSDEVALQLVKRIFEYTSESCTIIFQGGEPTLAGTEYFEKFVDAVHRFNTKKVETDLCIQTNGYDVPDDMIRFFKKHDFLVGVSLDGDKAMHEAMRPGSYERVIDTIERLKKSGVHTNILCVLTDINARNPQKLYSFFKKKDLTFLQLIPQIRGYGSSLEHSLSPERYAKFLKAFFDLYCLDFFNGTPINERTIDNYIMRAAGLAPECCGFRGVCSANIAVEYDGSVYPCDFYMTEEYLLGNIADMSFEQMLSSEKAMKFVRESENLPSDCLDCEYYDICAGGCRRQRENSAQMKNIYCKSYKDFFGYAMPEIKEIADILTDDIRNHPQSVLEDDGGYYDGF